MPEHDQPIQAQPELDLDALRDEGYLHEANRRFFHPLGLALGVRSDMSGGQRLVVFDGRDDDEGVVMGEVLSPEKAARVAAEWERRARVRMDTLGFVVEPVPEEG